MGIGRPQEGRMIMNTLSDAVRKHHLSLAKTLSAHARAVGGAEDQTERDSFVAFLTGDLLPHARGEELHLYPAVDELVQRHGKATATMTVDHEFIGGYVARIKSVSQQLRQASNGERPRLLQQLREMALQLDAIFQLHLAKEERVYLPLIEQHLEDADQRRLLAAIHESSEEDKKTQPDTPLGVRNAPCILPHRSGARSDFESLRGNRRG
jgi:hemerythrin-like domain-containing protein